MKKFYEERNYLNSPCFFRLFSGVPGPSKRLRRSKVILDFSNNVNTFKLALLSLELLFHFAMTGIELYKSQC